MPAGMGESERFAAAVENGTTPASYGRGDDSASVARELEIVAMLRSGAGPALGPDPDARGQAKRRFMAAVAQEFGHDVDTALEYAGVDASAPTGPLAVLAPVALATRPERAGPTETTATHLRRATRAGRHSAPEPDLAPETVDEPDTAEPDAPDNVRPLRRRETRGGPRRGAAFFGAAAAATLVAMAGAGAFASQDALPGDPMYGVKRVAESTGYALTFGEQAKARRHLEQAQHRLDEVEGLVTRDRTTAVATPKKKASDQDLVRNTMQEFDTDTNEGSRQLLSGSKPDTGQVKEVQTWATQQSQRLSEIRSTLPAPDRADESLALLDRVLGETAALQDAACVPGVGGSASSASGNGSAGGSGTATAGDDACAPTAATTTQGQTRTRATPTTGDPTTGDPTTDDPATRAGTSTTGRHDDGGTDVGSDGSAGTDSGDTSAQTTTTGSSRTGSSDGTSDKRRRSGGSDGSGGSGGSGSSGGSGASGGSDGSSASDSSGGGSISVPVLPGSGVGVPPVGPLPGLRLG